MGRRGGVISIAAPQRGTWPKRGGVDAGQANTPERARLGWAQLGERVAVVRQHGEGERRKMKSKKHGANPSQTAVEGSYSSIGRKNSGHKACRTCHGSVVTRGPGRMKGTGIHV